MKIAVVSALLLFGAALPAVAQMPPPSGEMPDGPGGMHGRGRMFASMSPAGRATMMAAMRSADPKAAHAATQAARDRMLTVLDADRLDAGALRRAMDDERESVNGMKIRQQAAMLVAFQQLSLADRRAFVADARAMRQRVENRMAGMRGRGGLGNDRMPPPQ